MRWLLRVTDRQALYIADRWNPAWQMRSGVWLVWFGLVHIIGFFVPALQGVAILSLSIIAAVVGGPQIIATARLAMQQSETDEDIEELKRDK